MLNKFDIKVAMFDKSAIFTTAPFEMEDHLKLYRI